MNQGVKVTMQVIQDYDEMVKKAWELAQDELSKQYIKKEQLKERIDWHMAGMMALHESGVTINGFDE